MYIKETDLLQVCNTKHQKFKCPHVRMFPGDKTDARELVCIGGKTFVCVDADTKGVSARTIVGSGTCVGIHTV